MNSGSDCKGVDLLSNFGMGSVDKGSNDPCSDNYKGPFPMSAVEISYQTKIKKEMKNILMTLTLSNIGAKITMGPAHTLVKLEKSARYEKYLQAFTNATTGYTYGAYAVLHGLSFGHPLDHNEASYGYSFNVALPSGTVNSDVYQHMTSALHPMFEQFVRGLMGMITYARNDQVATSTTTKTTTTAAKSLTTEAPLPVITGGVEEILTIEATLAGLSEFENFLRSLRRFL